MRGLLDFLGNFDVSREIEDRRAQAKSRFEGQAVITATPHGASYVETGALIMNDQRFVAQRQYHWREDAGQICVSFADGRPFHDFDPNTGGDATEHLCGNDLYRGGYDFSQWSCWEVTWTVQGPRKDYVSTTWYVRR